MSVTPIIFQVTIVQSNEPFKDQPGITWETSRAKLSPITTFSAPTIHVRNETLQISHDIPIQPVASPPHSDTQYSEQKDTNWNLLRDLHKIIKERFNEDELRTLCFYLAIRYDDLPGEGKLGKARELLFYVESRGTIGNLIKYGMQMRPDIRNWPDRN